MVANLAALSLLGTVVNKFLNAWEKIEKIRRIRTDLAGVGLKGTALQELTEQITTTVTEVVEDSTEVALTGYNGSKERRNELSNAINQDMLRLFGQIERGLKVEFRAEPQPGTADENQKSLQEIANAAKQLKFPEVSAEPLLLASGKVIEDGPGVTFARHTTKKSTTQSTTTSRKEAAKETKEEPGKHGKA